MPMYLENLFMTTNTFAVILNHQNLSISNAFQNVVLPLYCRSVLK